MGNFWLWVIGIFLVLALIGSFLPEEQTQEEPELKLLTPTKSNTESSNSNEVKETSNKITGYTTKETEDSNEILVVDIIDGDTIELNTGERVRLICIDTPERNEYYYQEASDYLENLILNEEVELVKDISETDRYGRLLRYIYLNGDFINEIMVEEGYAEAYPYKPDTKLCPQIEEAEDKAKSKNLGIWAEEKTKEEESKDSEVICSSDKYNCGDFSTCSEVREVFDSCSYDIHKLDRDNDGVPCESLCS